MSKKSRRRKYDATKRQQQAAASRERILEVAATLFARDGYVETTIEAIASGADVSAPTVYAAFGSKRGILSSLFDRLVSGEGEPQPILETARAREVLAEPDPVRAVTLFASHMLEIQDRIGPLFGALRHAARTEAEAAELYKRVQRNRLASLEAFARALEARGALREGLTAAEAGRTIWVLASPNTRTALQTHGGWTSEQVNRWLADTLVAALLRPALVDQ